MLTAQTGFCVKEVPDYTPFGQMNDKAFQVKLDGSQVAFMYVTPVTYTLAWEGTVAFDSLEAEVTGALRALGWKDASINDPIWRNRTSVALVFQHPENSDELAKYRLDQPKEYNSYTKAIQEPFAISFARYDFSDNRENRDAGLLCSFIAENAMLQQGLETEVALKLPRHHKCNETMIDWMITHHTHHNLLTKAVAREPSVSTLNQYLEIS